MEERAVCHRADAVECVDAVGAVVRCGDAVRECGCQRTQDGVDHGRNHVPRAADRRVRGCRKEGAVRDLDVQGREITFVHRILRREQVLDGDPSRGHRAAVATRVQGTDKLGRYL